MGETEDEKCSQAGQLFENFVQASTCKGTLQAFGILCRQLELDPLDHKNFYSRLKAKVTSWKAKGLWSKLDKRAGQKDYKKGKSCVGTKCLIIGGGPCGLRTAIELALLGAKVVVIEKRDTFSRNNVLHLWPYTIHDLRGLGAKKFYGKFCAGSIDHISIRQLQLMLLKVSLILAVEVHVNVEFVKLLEPPEDQENEGPGWRAEICPSDHPISDFDFDVVVGADGRRNTLEGFRRKEFRGKLAIAITANFINRNTTAEAKVEEISGVAFIFNQKFFLELKEEMGIDLENIVYYKDNTHYFVMTAKKQSLLDKGVIIHDYADTEMLLSGENMQQEALLSYAREAADFATNYQLPSLDYAMNHNGQPDVAMFDFTCMYASENAALVRERFGHRLLVALVGDSLLEPFWPMGTGCARGFLAAFDTAWMTKSWAQGRPPLEILAEREGLYRLLPQTTPENITKNFEQYTIDPATRYPNLNSNCVRPHQVRHLYITGELQPGSLERAASVRRPVNLGRRESDVRPSRLLTWCQRHTEGYRNVCVSDLTSSWKSGLALCALIHNFRADLIDFDSLNEEESAKNNQMAFDIAERELGIPPVTTGLEMASDRDPDKLNMVLYLSKFYEMFRGDPIPASGFKRETDQNEDYSGKIANSISNLKNLSLPRKRIPKGEQKSDDKDTISKRRRKFSNYLEEATNFPSQTANSVGEDTTLKENKVKFMATKLQAKFEENVPTCSLRRQGSLRREFPPSLGGSDTCHFCQKRVYVMERLSAEGLFFHRECFRCDTCSATLRLGGQAFDSDQGRFYCKLHFAQQKALIKHRRRTVELQKGDQEVGAQGGSVTMAPDGKAPHSADSIPESQPAESCPQPLETQVGIDTHSGTRQTGWSAPSATTETVQTRVTEVTLQASDPEGSDGPDITHSSSLGIQRRSPWPAAGGLGASHALPRVRVTAGDCGKRADPCMDHWGQGQVSPGSPLTPPGSPSLFLFENPLHSPDPSPPECQPTSVTPKSPNPIEEQPDERLPSSGKKKLTISLLEREKLLQWDLDSPDEPETQETTESARISGRPSDQKASCEISIVPPVTIPTSTPAQSHPSQSPFQLVADALRRSFGHGSPSSTSNATRSCSSQKSRPTSEGSFKLSSLLWGKTGWDHNSNSKGGGQNVHPGPSLNPTALAKVSSALELPNLLENVSLGEESGRISKDDMAIVSHKNLNVFSSLRVKKTDRMTKRVTGGQENDIWSMVSNLRQKVSSQEQMGSSSSSEDESTVSSPKDSPSLKQKRRQERTMLQKARQEQLKRLHRAQVIQRQLEEVEEKQRTLEENGVILEKMLRGEMGQSLARATVRNTHILNPAPLCSLEDGSPCDETELLQTWYRLVLEKNRLGTYESELMIFAQELELEDTQSQLQQKLWRSMAVEDSRKSPQELSEEQQMFAEMMRVVEKRDALVVLLEERRISENTDGRDLESIVHQFHWT
ncbi:F-actin-monooxygenase mical2b isoform X2 [Brienomyrus brachyistius]|uniref:F-actin-monooxygenase mical2b isoform X2 n=1 Tax=Brienomyrus brachyistius TaxID=42636 RepID=UPI0020B1C0C4|nr:F-actin-monooxygenase mical2b isoform X2 [Brienomyrus brachyistius]